MQKIDTNLHCVWKVCSVHTSGWLGPFSYILYNSIPVLYFLSDRVRVCVLTEWPYLEYVVLWFHIWNIPQSSENDITQVSDLTQAIPPWIPPASRENIDMLEQVTNVHVWCVKGLTQQTWRNENHWRFGLDWVRHRVVGGQMFGVNIPCHESSTTPLLYPGNRVLSVDDLVWLQKLCQSELIWKKALYVHVLLT